MIIIPAIDLKDGQVVRLKQGKMQDSTLYHQDPVAQATQWIEAMKKSGQVSRLHLVDLNGAFQGQPVHFEIIKQISLGHPDTKIEIGGGIRRLETIQKYFDCGVSFCIVGTAAVKNPAFLEEACQKFPGRIILGLDAKNGLVATDGWDKTSTMKATELIQKFQGLNIESIVYTDIAKDGMLEGMNHDSIREMASQSPFPIIGSGGLTSLDDIITLKKVPNVMGVIAGKALYENRFSLEEAMSV